MAIPGNGSGTLSWQHPVGILLAGASERRGRHATVTKFYAAKFSHGGMGIFTKILKYARLKNIVSS